MTIEVKGTRIDIAQLSDGEKCLVAMAGDIARRMVLAMPKAPNPLETEAVVLIDEIELHLHPGLQRTILPRLRKAFPKAQLIVTTHSPPLPELLLVTHPKMGQSPPAPPVPPAPAVPPAPPVATPDPLLGVSPGQLSQQNASV